MIKPYGQVRGIVSLLPDFDPSVDESLNSMQFIKRVEFPKSDYGWDDPSVIFGTQQKMKYHAKYWINSLGEVLKNWSQFTYKFLLDFCRFPIR